MLCCGLIALFSLTFWTVGLFIDRAVEYISPEMESVLFASFSPDKAAMKPGNEKVKLLQEMVDELSYCLQLSYPVKVHLLESATPNAAAFPGGRIIVLTGLLDKIQSRNGLTFILAHELAHFKNRDHLRALGRGIVFTALASFATGAGSELTQLITPTVSLNQAQHSQDRESLADQLALDVLFCHYQHVGGATEFFEAMMKSDLEGSSFSHYFASHPEARDRINALQNQAANNGYPVYPVEPLPVILESLQKPKK